MKKLLCIALTATLAVGILASCGKKATSSDGLKNNSSNPSSNLSASTADPNATPFKAQDVPSQFKASGKNVTQNAEGGVDVAVEERQGDDRHAFESEDLGFIDTTSGALIKVGMTAEEIESLIGEPRLVDSRGDYRTYSGIVIQYTDGKAAQLIVALGNMDENDNVNRFVTPRGVKISMPVDEFKSVYGDEYTDGTQNEGKEGIASTATMAVRYYAQNGNSYSYLGENSPSKDTKPANDADLIMQRFIFDTGSKNITVMSIENGEAKM